MPTSNFLLDQGCVYKFTFLITNSADPDQEASSEVNWSESTLFAKGAGGLYPGSAGPDLIVW